VTSNSTTSSIHGLRLKAAADLATPLLQPHDDLEAQLPAAVAPTPAPSTPKAAVAPAPKPKAAAAEDERLCPICLSDEPLPDVKCNSDCTAEFHEGCLRDWLIDHNNSCPLCRRQPMAYCKLGTGQVLIPKVTNPARRIRSWSDLYVQVDYRDSATNTPCNACIFISCLFLFCGGALSLLELDPLNAAYEVQNNPMLVLLPSVLTSSVLDIKSESSSNQGCVPVQTLLENYRSEFSKLSILGRGPSPVKDSKGNFLDRFSAKDNYDSESYLYKLHWPERLRDSLKEHPNRVYEEISICPGGVSTESSDSVSPQEMVDFLLGHACRPLQTNLEQSEQSSSPEALVNYLSKNYPIFSKALQEKKLDSKIFQQHAFFECLKFVDFDLDEMLPVIEPVQLSMLASTIPTKSSSDCKWFSKVFANDVTGHCTESEHESKTVTVDYPKRLGSVESEVVPPAFHNFGAIFTTVDNGIKLSNYENVVEELDKAWSQGTIKV